MEAKNISSNHEGCNKTSEKTFNHEGRNTNTELCVNLKTILRKDAKMKTGKRYRGYLYRDAEAEADDYQYRDAHFTFIEAPAAAAVKRNPHIFAGKCINVIRKDDGTMYPTFNRPAYTRDFTFHDFCRKAAEELIKVTGLIEK